MGGSCAATIRAEPPCNSDASFTRRCRYSALGTESSAWAICAAIRSTRKVVLLRIGHLRDSPQCSVRRVKGVSTTRTREFLTPLLNVDINVCCRTITPKHNFEHDSQLERNR